MLNYIGAIKMEYIIYMHTNTLNDKKYIGQTVLKLEERWRKGNGYINQPKFYRAIKKYGWEVFKHTILEICNSREEANLREQYWIDYYNSIKNGYNVSQGGAIPQYFCKAVYQLDQFKNILAVFSSTREAERKTGIPQANISHCCCGKINSVNGYWWCYIPDYQKYIIKPIGPSDGRPLAVVQLDLSNTYITKFNSLTEAEKATGIPHQNISKCCSGKLKTAGGFKWRYINEKRQNKN